MKSVRHAALQAHRMPATRRQAPDVEAAHPLMPQQYYDLITRRHVLDGERRLLFAVLEDAIRSYVTSIDGDTAAKRREFDEVRAWIGARGSYSLFAFDTICAMFEIEPDLLRQQLDSLRASDLPRRRLRTVGRRVPMSVPV